MRKRKKAAGAMPFGVLWRVTEEDCKRRGLSTDFKACIRAYARAIMPLPRSITGCRRSGLESVRRTIAAPSRGVFLWAVVPTHGVIASAFLMGAPCGTPSGVLFPNRQSANPHGAARPRSGGVSGFKNRLLGA